MQCITWKRREQIEIQSRRRIFSKRADTFGRPGFGKGLAADAMLGLDFAECGKTAMEDTVELGVVDGLLMFFGFGVLHGFVGRELGV
jgi:hypothetical protein